MRSEPTNTLYFDVSPLTGYLGRDHAAWKCPGDTTRQVRSMSTNNLVGGNGLSRETQYYGQWTSPYQLLRKLSLMKIPPMTWVITDEHPSSSTMPFWWWT